MKLKNIAIIEAAVIAAMVPISSNVQTVKAEDYCIELVMDINELPINYIDSSRKAYIPIRVCNNPGINHLSFIIEKDERITGKVYAIRALNFPFDNELQTSQSSVGRYVGVQAGYISENYYDTDGLFCTLEVVLPEDYALGDFYSFNFYPDNTGGPCNIEFKKDGNNYGKEHFSYVNGGIKIIDAVNYAYTPEETEPPETEAPVIENQPQPSENHQEPPKNQPSEEHNQNNTSNNENNSGSNLSETATTESIVTTVPVTSSTSEKVTTVPKTSATSVSKSVLVKVTTDIAAEKNIVTDVVSEPEQTEPMTTVGKSEDSKSKNNILIAAVSALAVLAAGVTAVIFKKIKNKKEKK